MPQLRQDRSVISLDTRVPRLKGIGVTDFSTPHPLSQFFVPDVPMAVPCAPIAVEIGRCCLELVLHPWHERPAPGQHGTPSLLSSQPHRSQRPNPVFAWTIPFSLGTQENCSEKLIEKAGTRGAMEKVSSGDGVIDIMCFVFGGAVAGRVLLLPGARDQGRQVPRHRPT